MIQSISFQMPDTIRGLESLPIQARSRIPAVLHHAQALL
jgi:hypothetical protein